MKSIFLYPGQMTVSQEPAIIATMLGSCVGVALWDKRLKTGGLNHYLLPEVVGEERPSPRYGSFAVPGLIDAMIAAGSQRGDLVARVYGGAAVLGQVSIGQKIGEKNIQLALKVLADRGITIVEKNVAGEKGRKIALNTVTGEVTHSLAGEEGGRVDTSGFGSFAEAKDVKVVIVDDSATVRNIFEKIFARHGLKVVGTAANAFEAREIIVREKPDVITLDIEMPQMNGVRFLEKLMKHMPIPVVMVSSLGSQGEAALESLRLGAVEFVQKPSQYDPEMLRELGQTLVTKVRAAATMNLLKSRTAAPVNSAPTRSPRSALQGQVAGVFVSGNTGAPASLTKMLSKFTGDTPPLVICVSTLCGFVESFIRDIKKQTGVDCRVATDGTMLMRGVAYFLPEGVHGRVVSQGGSISLKLEKGPSVSGQLPSGDRLLESAAQVLGPAAIGVLLSGFGSDGVQGLAKIHGKGGYTLVENPSEAGFPFVPQGAVELGVASEVVSANEVFESLMAYRDRKSA